MAATGVRGLWVSVCITEAYCWSVTGCVQHR